MKITAQRKTRYAELSIDLGDITFRSGLLNDTERTKIALDLLNMLGDLLPDSMKAFDDELTELVNKHF